jgi:hypothetical protein
VGFNIWVHSDELGHHVECHNRSAGSNNNTESFGSQQSTCPIKKFSTFYETQIFTDMFCLNFWPKIALWKELCRVVHCYNKEPKFIFNELNFFINYAIINIRNWRYNACVTVSCVGTDFYWTVPVISWKKNVSILGHLMCLHLEFLILFAGFTGEASILSWVRICSKKAMSEQSLYLFVAHCWCFSNVWMILWSCHVAEPSVVFNVISSWNCLSYTRISF